MNLLIPIMFGFPALVAFMGELAHTSKDYYVPQFSFRNALST
jgi:hypothetical protein